MLYNFVVYNDIYSSIRRYKQIGCGAFLLFDRNTTTAKSNYFEKNNEPDLKDSPDVFEIPKWIYLCLGCPVLSRPCF